MLSAKKARAFGTWTVATIAAKVGAREKGHASRMMYRAVARMQKAKMAAGWRRWWERHSSRKSKSTAMKALDRFMSRKQEGKKMRVWNKWEVCAHATWRCSFALCCPSFTFLPVLRFLLTPERRNRRVGTCRFFVFRSLLCYACEARA